MLELLNVDRFDEMYGIMEYSFPESERRSREGQRKLFADPRYKVAAQSDERGRLEAFLAYWQLEKVTFLEHFAVAADLRGAGLRGASGIPPVRGRLIRPLLCLDRPEIEAYLAGRGVSFVTDSTNLSTDYARNRMRQRVIAPLREAASMPVR